RDHAAARAADRLLDRRPAGTHRPGRGAWTGAGPRAGADHAAHAADVHDHSGRASGARERRTGARGRRRRGDRARHDLPRSRRPPHDDRAAQQSAGHFAQRRPAHQLLPPCGRSAVFQRRAGMGCGDSLRDPDRHGLGRNAWRAGRGRGWRQRDGAGRGDKHRMGHAGRGGECRRLRGGAAARSDRPEDRAVVPGRQVVTPLDYDYLRKLLKDRSGLVLSADKQYLVESRLSPLARKAGVATLGELVAKLKGNNERMIVDVVEAMTTNESFFYRDKIPFDHFRDAIMPGLMAARAKERRIRIWCTAASTGQEPYSLAMSMREMKP